MPGEKTSSQVYWGWRSPWFGLFDTGAWEIMNDNEYNNGPWRIIEICTIKDILSLQPHPLSAPRGRRTEKKTHGGIIRQ